MLKPSYNRYQRGILVKQGNLEWIAPNPEEFDVRPRPDDRFHTVVEGDRLDLLAHKYLLDARLYWVICLYNNIFWFMEEEKLKPGTELRIPSYTTLISEILV